MSRFRWSAIRIVYLAPVLFLAAIILPGLGALSSRVEAADGSQHSYLFQDYPPADDAPTADPNNPGYPGPGDPGDDDPLPGYPGPGDTDTSPEPAESTPTVPAADTPIPIETPSPTIELTQTVGPSPTLGASPTAGETPTTAAVPTGTETPVETPTALTALTRPVVTRTPTEKQGGGIDWGLFWIGFSLPVLAACGLVLYLLDRQPMLLQRRGKKP